MDQIQKKLMTKFSDKLKKPYFGPFSQFLGQLKKKKNSSVSHNNTLASNTMLSFRKKTERWKDRKTDLIHRTLPATARGSKNQNKTAPRPDVEFKE